MKKGDFMTFGTERKLAESGPHSHAASVAPASATAQVISLSELQGEALQSEHPPAHILENANPLHSVRTRLQVCVGQVEVSLGELLGAREHQVLVLDHAVEQAVDLLLEGKTVARGQLMAVDGNFALRITELPVSLRP
jgi:flagellar motor switch protein FliN/FliY